MADFEILRCPIPRELPAPVRKDFNCLTNCVTQMGSLYTQVIPVGYEIRELYYLESSKWGAFDLELIASIRHDWGGMQLSSHGYGSNDIISVRVTRNVSEDVYERESREWAEYLKRRNNRHN